MTPNQLKARFPYQFAGPNLGFGFYRGWMAAFSQLCEDIDTLLGEDKRHFHWQQLKEKMGIARCYFSIGRPWQRGNDGRLVDSAVDRPDDPVYLPIGVLVHAYEVATSTQCAVCGAPGRMDYGAWLLTLCPAHAEQRKTGVLPPFWLNEDEQ